MNQLDIFGAIADVDARIANGETVAFVSRLATGRSSVVHKCQPGQTCQCASPARPKHVSRSDGPVRSYRGDVAPAGPVEVLPRAQAPVVMDGRTIAPLSSERAKARQALARFVDATRL